MTKHPSNRTLGSQAPNDSNRPAFTPSNLISNPPAPVRCHDDMRATTWPPKALSHLQYPLSDSAGPWTSSSSPTTPVMQAICPQKLYITILRRLTSPLPPAMSLPPGSSPIPRPIHHHDPVTETNGATRPNPWRGRLSPGDDDEAPPSGMRRGTRPGPGLGIWPMAVAECPSPEISSWPPSPNGASITNTQRASSGERHNALSLPLPACPSAPRRHYPPRVPSHTHQYHHHHHGHRTKAASS